MDDYDPKRVLRGDTDIRNWGTRYKRRDSWDLIIMRSPNITPAIGIQHADFSRWDDEKREYVWSNEWIAIVLGGKDNHELRLSRSTDDAGRLGRLLCTYQDTGMIVDDGFIWSTDHLNALHRLRYREGVPEAEAIQMVMQGNTDRFGSSPSKAGTGIPAACGAGDTQPGAASGRWRS
jgi:hypothetical protein